MNHSLQIRANHIKEGATKMSQTTQRIPPIDTQALCEPDHPARLDDPKPRPTHVTNHNGKRGIGSQRSMTYTQAIGALGALVRGQKEHGTGTVRRTTKAVVGNKANEDPTTLDPTKEKAALKAEVRKESVLTTAALRDNSGPLEQHGGLLRLVFGKPENRRYRRSQKTLGTGLFRCCSFLWSELFAED